MMTSKKKVLVIGGGFSGIGSIKCLKEEGFDPVCYEKTSNMGGTWYYREATPMGIPSIMPSTVINHSKEMGAVTNFVPDKSYPNYMRHYELLRLFTDIGNKFDCLRHIVYDREVTRVTRSADYDETGRWDVTVKNTLTGEITDEVYDVVWVGVGQFTFPKMATYPGMEKFQGTIIHTHDLKRVEQFKDKRVAVIGIGCSGLDAAVEISNVASQVYLSTRSGAWIMPRVGPYGLPFDYAMIRRFATVMQTTMGFNFCSWYLEKYYVNNHFNHNLYNLRPTYHVMSKDPATNDLIPAKIISGAVTVRRDVKFFTEKGVVFENESEVTPVDAVIMGTGYRWQFPFLEEGTVRVEDGRINLYKCVFPTHLKHPTLAVIGFILPFGPGFPLGEMQCRWAARILNGHCKLPSEQEMLEDVKTRHEENSKRFAPSDKMTVRVDYIAYMDELAKEIGCKPNFWKLLVTDFELYKALVFGPSLPYQYRLEGPHKWDGARKAILTAHERVKYPLQGEIKKKTKKPLPLSAIIRYVITALIIAYWFTQNEASLKTYLVAAFFAYYMTWNGFYRKLYFALFMLPFFVPWDGFVSSYLITIFVPILLSSL